MLLEKPQQQQQQRHKEVKLMDNEHKQATQQLKVCFICSLVIINANQLQTEQLLISVSLACIYCPIVFVRFCLCWAFPWK